MTIDNDKMSDEQKSIVAALLSGSVQGNPTATTQYKRAIANANNDQQVLATIHFFDRAARARKGGF